MKMVRTCSYRAHKAVLGINSALIIFLSLRLISVSKYTTLGSCIFESKPNQLLTQLTKLET
jgi:hypothetical protein